MTNNVALTITNQNAAFSDTNPAGISLTNVLGLLASISLSNHLLNAIAALLANTMQRTTKIKRRGLNSIPVASYPMKKPIMANGKAKIVWLNLIRDK